VIIKTKIHNKLGISVDLQRLVYAGKTLKNDDPLTNIPKQSTLILIQGMPDAKIPCFYIDPSCLDPKHDHDFTHVIDGGILQQRGGRPYYRPYGWQRYALKVSGIFGSDTWLGHTGRGDNGEWPVSYHGTSRHNAKTIAEDGYDLSKGMRFIFGQGIYSTPSIRVAEQYAHQFELNGSRYKVILQNRINPNPENLIVIPASRNGVRGEYFVSKTEADVIPYGILIKKIRTRQVKKTARIAGLNMATKQSNYKPRRIQTIIGEQTKSTAHVITPPDVMAPAVIVSFASDVKSMKSKESNKTYGSVHRCTVM
jgi:hypothetical protein